MGGVFIGRPQSFRYHRRPVGDYTPGRGGWRKPAEQGAGRFMVKWVAVEKVRAGLRHAVVCPNVTGRTKERIAQRTSTHVGSLALVDSPRTAQTCILRADVVRCLSLELRLFCFRVFLVFFAFFFNQSRGPSFNSSSIYIRPGSHRQLSNNCLCPLLFCFF